VRRTAAAWITGACLAIASAGNVAAALPGPDTDKASTAPASAHAKTMACPKPADPIKIQSVRISEDPIRVGTSVSGTVIATCNVAAVTAQVGTFRIGVPKRSPGVFQTTVKVPRLAWPGHFKLIVTAIRTDGFSIHETIPIVVTW
jgi:hypothetical protein